MNQKHLRKALLKVQKDRLEKANMFYRIRQDHHSDIIDEWNRNNPAPIEPKRPSSYYRWDPGRNKQEVDEYDRKQQVYYTDINRYHKQRDKFYDGRLLDITCRKLGISTVEYADIKKYSQYKEFKIKEMEIQP